jgi:DNA polymerase-3 subunit beta
MMANLGKTSVYSPLIAGEYINYKQILPATWTTAVKVNRQQLIGAIERAALIAREGNNLLKLHVDDKVMTIYANTERGNAVEKVEVAFDGAPLDIAFNARYLLDVIRNIDTPEMAMRYNTNVSPCVVCPVTGNQYTYLVLPVRTID